MSNRCDDLKLKAYAANLAAKEIDGLVLNSTADSYANVSRSTSSTTIATATPPITLPGTPVGVPTTSPVQGPGSTINSSGRPVKVLVALKGNYTLEGEMGKASILAQRRAIAAIQERVITAIKADTSSKRNPRASVRVTRRYVTVPGLAFELKPEVLEDLKRLPDVAAVYEDKLNSLALDSTTRRIGSRVVNNRVFGVDGTDQVVAVLDTGIFRGHPFLGTSRFVANACFSGSSWFSNDEQTLCPNGEDEQVGGESARNCNIKGCEHGTHVAGIVGGFRDDNSNGLVDISDFKGVAPRVKFVAMQIFHRVNNEDVCGGSDKTPCIKSSDSDVIAGLDQVELVSEDHPIAAVNLSIQSGEHRGFCDDNFLMKWAIDDLRSRKIATVVAAGNSRFSAALASPACISSAISVGNTQDDDTVANSSNTSDLLSLLAPGTSVCSSVPGSGSGCGATGFASMNGTSMAAPHVAGLWALMKQHRSSQDQSTSVGSIRNQLRDTGVDVTEDGVTTPRVNVVKALGLKAVVISTSANVINLANALGTTRTINLNRSNFTGSLDLVTTIQGGSAGDLRVGFSTDPTTSDSVSMTVSPEISANGSYTVNISGAASGVGVIPMKVTVNVLPPEPTITGFSPPSGHVTNWVTINGQNFSRVTEVQFRGSARIRPLVDSSTSIRVQVPASATSGRLWAYNGNIGDASLDWFFVTPDPVIVSLSPRHAPLGASVIINGHNFNNATTVRINNVPVSGLSVTPTRLSFNVPQTTLGAHVLRVTTSHGNATTNFTVGYPRPTIDVFDPQIGTVGTTLNIAGSGFYGLVRVNICDIRADTTVLDPNHVRAVVPEGVGNSCIVRVVTLGGTAQANRPFVNGL